MRKVKVVVRPATGPPREVEAELEVVPAPRSRAALVARPPPPRAVSRSGKARGRGFFCPLCQKEKAGKRHRVKVGFVYAEVCDDCGRPLLAAAELVGWIKKRMKK